MSKPDYTSEEKKLGRSAGMPTHIVNCMATLPCDTYGELPEMWERGIIHLKTDFLFYHKGNQTNFSNVVSEGHKILKRLGYSQNHIDNNCEFHNKEITANFSKDAAARNRKVDYAFFDYCGYVMPRLWLKMRQINLNGVTDNFQFAVTSHHGCDRCPDFALVLPTLAKFYKPIFAHSANAKGEDLRRIIALQVAIANSMPFNVRVERSINYKEKMSTTLYSRINGDRVTNAIIEVEKIIKNISPEPYAKYLNKYVDNIIKELERLKSVL